MKARPKKKATFQSATLLAGALLLLIIFVSAGFILTTQQEAETRVDPTYAAFQLARRKWRNREPESYAYAVDRDCFCEPLVLETYDVRVENDTIRFSMKQNPDQAPPRPDSIADIFELMDKAFQENAAVTVTYDPDFSYPDNLRIDWDRDRADEEESLYIREFREIP